MTHQPAMEQRLRDLTDPWDDRPATTGRDYIAAAQQFDHRVEVFYLRAAIMRLTDHKKP